MVKPGQAELAGRPAVALRGSDTWFSMPTALQMLCLVG